MMQAVQVTIKGRVQGVGYRDFTRRVARQLGVAGWVRNLPDGDVEALLCAEAAIIDQMLARLREGPPLSRVQTVMVRPVDSPMDVGDSFMIR